MNRLIPLTLALLLAAAPLGFAEARSIRVEVNGLVCAFCADGITRALKKQPATDEVFVSLEHRLVAVGLKDGQDIADEVLKKTLVDAGYTVVGIERTDDSVAAIRAGVGR